MNYTLKLRLKRTITSLVYKHLVEILKIITILILIFNIYTGMTSVGVIAIFTSVSASINSLVMLSISINTLAGSFVSYQKHDEFFEDPQWGEPKPLLYGENQEKITLTEITEIRFEDVGFRYNESFEEVLSDINLTIKKNEYIQV